METIKETKDISLKNNSGIYVGLALIVIAIIAGITIFIKTKSCK